MKIQTVLYLNAEETQTLYTILRKVGGDPSGNRRHADRLLNSLSGQLEARGVDLDEYKKMRLATDEGFIYFLTQQRIKYHDLL